jgi:integrase
VRTRHQDGWVEERGGRIKSWYGHYYVYELDGHGKEIRRHHGVHLGEKSRFRKWEAEHKLREVIAAAAKKQPASDRMTLEWFARERFLVMREPLWAPSTKETNTYNIEHHILPALGKKLLSEVDKFSCQVFLNSLAKRGFSFTVVDHNRTTLKAILEEAVDADLIGKNPARKLTNPDTKESQKHVLPKELVRLLLDSLPFRDRLVTMIAAFCAMRPGEIFGLRWSSWRRDHFFVEGRHGVALYGPAKQKPGAAKHL